MTTLTQINAFAHRFEASLTDAERPEWFALDAETRKIILFTAYIAGTI